MARIVKKKKEKQVEPIVIGKRNMYFFLGGLFLIILGYILMAQPPVYGFLSLHLAPIILVFAYLVVIPFSIMIKDKTQSAGD
ncbi:MAG: DUF3098 domain-containing protein [Calditrichaeota bacterium]|nr:DUF3098 domain-containing protein [Calditrichota bacterium]